MLSQVRIKNSGNGKFYRMVELLLVSCTMEQMQMVVFDRFVKILDGTLTSVEQTLTTTGRKNFLTQGITLKSCGKFRDKQQKRFVFSAVAENLQCFLYQVFNQYLDKVGQQLNFRRFSMIFLPMGNKKVILDAI